MNSWASKIILLGRVFQWCLIFEGTYVVFQHQYFSLQSLGPQDHVLIIFAPAVNYDHALLEYDSLYFLGIHCTFYASRALSHMQAQPIMNSNLHSNSFSPIVQHQTCSQTPVILRPIRGPSLWNSWLEHASFSLSVPQHFPSGCQWPFGKLPSCEQHGALCSVTWIVWRSRTVSPRQPSAPWEQELFLYSISRLTNPECLSGQNKCCLLGDTEQMQGQPVCLARPLNSRTLKAPHLPGELKGFFPENWRMLRALPQRAHGAIQMTQRDGVLLSLVIIFETQITNIFLGTPMSPTWLMAFFS